MCFTKRCWLLSCSLQHLTAFHLLPLLDQPRAAVTSAFPALTSHARSRPRAHAAGRPLARRLREDVLVGWPVSVPGRARASGMAFRLRPECEYATWELDSYEL